MTERNIEHTKIDTDRESRNGFPEVIYGEGKTAQQIIDIVCEMIKLDHPILATRIDNEKGEHIERAIDSALYCKLSKTVTVTGSNHSIDEDNIISIVTAGTSDLAIAAEAKVTAEIMGYRANIISDVGVAGIHRLFNSLDEIKRAKIVIVIAGMEGALSSVIGGLIDTPIIAVPTSIGYGANFGGVSALLGMLTSCASGITVVNIDNGFGAACAAVKILNTFTRKE